MKKSFAARRVPRRIGDDGDEEAEEVEVNEPIVKRPQLLHKGKRKSTPRRSFGPSAQDDDNDDEDLGAVVRAPSTNKKIGPSRLSAVQTNESSGRSSPAAGLPFRAGLETERPSYSKEALRELQQSTPSTKFRQEAQAEHDGDKMAVDIASKFGPITRIGMGSAIPTEIEIREKKDRRARLAKEQEYISLYGEEEPYDDEDRREIILRTEEKYPETRLVPEDEDLAEGFDEFVEDGNIALGRKAEQEEKRRKRAEISSLIDNAGGINSDEESDDSEVERKAAYDAAQVRAGTYGQNITGQNDHDEEQRPKTPPKITPIPELSNVLGQLKDALGGMMETSNGFQRRLQELATEKVEVAEQEKWVQTQLKETGEKYEKIRSEAGLTDSPDVDGIGQNGKLAAHRGLETIGTPIGTPQESDDSDD